MDYKLESWLSLQTCKVEISHFQNMNFIVFKVNDGYSNVYLQTWIAHFIYKN